MLEREILSAEHGTLIRLADRLRASVTAFEPDIAAISALRWRMRRVLAAHLTKEDALLYPRLRTGTDPVAASVATQFAEEMGGLAAAYQAYMADWTADRIAADHDGFRSETVAVLDALGTRIAREEAELYPLLRASAA